MVAKRHGQMTVEDFLALDRENLDQKYEFINGQMVAMAGGSNNHTLIIVNLSGMLYTHLRKSPCATFSEGTLKIEDECYLPDIMVTCNEKDLAENKTYIEYPKLVIEVLSPSTELNNRRDKLLAYTQCPSIQEYILVNWDCMLIEKMTRKATEELDTIQWITQWYGKDETLTIDTIGLTILVDDVYERTILPPSNPLKIYRKRRNMLH
jgi:Uma2 family endonuclease